MNFYSFEEIDGFWQDFEDWDGVKSKEYNRLRNSHKFFRMMWDGIKKPKDMPIKHILIKHLKRAFPENESCHVGKPLGEFKDLMGKTHKEIYEALLGEMTKTRKNRDGLPSSYLRELKYYCELVWEEYFKAEHKWLKWDDEAFIDGLALMLYGSSIGILLESKTHDALSEWTSRQHTLNKLISYEAASADLESEDVDGIFRRLSDGKILVKVSIKCLGALDETFIFEKYRGWKKKTEPDIYIGYRYATDSKLSTVEVDGSLKDLLRRRLGE